MVGLLALIMFLQIDGPCAFGQLTEKSGAVTISGGHWTAVGYRKGNTIIVTWTLQGSDEKALGAYQVTETGIEGFWGWIRDVEFDPQGNPTGLDHHERLR